MILIPFYYTFLAVIDYASSDLVKLTKCILNNDLSIFLIIKLYTFIILPACGTGLVLDTTNQVCVCAVDYYQTADGSDTAPPTCAQNVHLEAPPMETQIVMHVVCMTKEPFPFLDMDSNINILLKFCNNLYHFTW